MTESFKISALHTEEMDDFIRLQWDAFAPLDKDMIMPMAFPLGPQPDMLQRFREDLATATATEGTGQQVDIADESVERRKVLDMRNTRYCHLQSSRSAGL
jgi:hypothetical protein